MGELASVWCGGCRNTWVNEPPSGPLTGACTRVVASYATVCQLASCIGFIYRLDPPWTFYHPQQKHEYAVGPLWTLAARGQ